MLDSDYYEEVERRSVLRASVSRLRTRSQNVILNLWDELALPHPVSPFDVAKFSKAEWLRRPYAGLKTISDIEQWLAQHGLKMWTREADTAANLEAHERAELARLKAKYEPPDA